MRYWTVGLLANLRLGVAVVTDSILYYFAWGHLFSSAAT